MVYELETRGVEKTVGATDAGARGEAELIGANAQPRVVKANAPTVLRLGHPSRLYRFADVGMVGGFANAAKLEITAFYEDAETGAQKKEQVSLPRGNWVLAVVDLDLGDKQGFFAVDNPFSKKDESNAD